MKKIIFLLLMAICSVSINAQISESSMSSVSNEGKSKDRGSSSTLDRGFTTTLDLALTYGVRNESYTPAIYYDLGYTIVKGLYIGVGPAVNICLSTQEDVDTQYFVGGYGRIRYAVPLRSEVKPFIDVRGGYNYNIVSSFGAPMCMVGLGIQVGERFNVGLYCSMSFSSYSYDTEERYQSGSKKMWIPGKIGQPGHYISYPTYSTRTVTHTENTSDYAPTVTFGWIF